MSKSTPEFVDPREAYAKPPFPNQKSFPMPGTTEQMDPRPDHGESSYEGSHQLPGRIALVTGGDSGIGRAVCLAFAREGAHVVVNYLSEDKDAQATVELCKTAGVQATAIKADLRSETECQSLISQVVDLHGRIDILVNNAAYQEIRQELDEMESELFDRIMKTNVYGPFYLTKAAAKHMNPGASVINTVSIQGYNPTDVLLPYATTKSALIGMTKGLAKLLMQQGVRVNGVAPGPVWTPADPRVDARGQGAEVRLVDRNGPPRPARRARAAVRLAGQRQGQLRHRGDLRRHRRQVPGVNDFPWVRHACLTPDVDQACPPDSPGKSQTGVAGAPKVPALKSAGRFASAATQKTAGRFASAATQNWDWTKRHLKVARSPSPAIGHAPSIQQQRNRF